MTSIHPAPRLCCNLLAIMAYLSDIDLATLHKKRLDEKHHYKLSWYNRRFYDDEMNHDQHNSLKRDEHKVKSKVGGGGSSDRSAKPKASALHANTKTSALKQACAANDGNNNSNKIAHDATAVNKGSTCNSIAYGNRRHSPDFYDEGYFSSPTLNRRRSGTWP